MSRQLINLHPAWHSQSAGPDLIAGLGLVGRGSGLEKEVGSCMEGQIKDQSKPGPEGLPEHTESSHFLKEA